MPPSSNYMQGCVVAFILCSLLGLICEGAFFGSSEATLLNDITKMGTFGGELFVIPLTLVSAISHMPQLLSGDFAFFSALGVFGALVRLIIWGPICYGLIWGFFIVLLPVVASIMLNLFRGFVSLVRP